MATNILSSLMSRAGGWRSLPGPQKAGGGEGKDPNIAAILAQGKKLADEQNVTGLEAVKDEFSALGLGPTYQVLLKSARTPTPEQQRNQQLGNALGDIVLRGIGMNPPGTQPTTPQTTVAPPTPREEAAQQSLIEPGPPAPVAEKPLSRPLGQLIVNGQAQPFVGLPDGMTVSYNTSTGSANVSLTAPTKSEFRKLIDGLGEMRNAGIITDAELGEALTFYRDKKIGRDMKEIRSITDNVTGITSWYAFDQRGRVIGENKFATDYTAEEKRQRAIAEKLTGIRQNEITGQQEATIFSPTGGVTVQPIPGQITQTPAQKEAQTKREKLTTSRVDVNEQGIGTLTILENGKPTNQESLGRIGPKPELTSEEKNRVQSFRTVQDSALDLKTFISDENLFQEYGTSIEELTGPVTGRARGVLAKIRSDPAYTKLQAKIGQLRPIIYALSGKAINPTEDKWLTEVMIPAIKENPLNLITRLDEFIDWVKRNRIDISATYLATGADVPLMEDIADEVRAKVSGKTPTSPSSENDENLEDLYKQFPYLRPQE